MHSRQNGKNTADTLQKDSSISESIEDIVNRVGRNNCNAQELFDALMKKKSSLSCIDKLTAGVQALCWLGWSDLAVHLYNAAGGFLIVHLICFTPALM